jgi:gamma-glutamyltranspeptidase/glutathione hydrolase
MRIVNPTVVTALVLATLVCSGHAADRLTGREFAMRSPVIAPHGMVASAHPLASQIGIDILKAGGNAVDAAIAVNAALGLMEPTGCGIGGDLFAIVWDAGDTRLYGLKSRFQEPWTAGSRCTNVSASCRWSSFWRPPFATPASVIRCPR